MSVSQNKKLEAILKKSGHLGQIWSPLAGCVRKDIKFRKNF
jgi:hypothetical protein